MDETRAGSKAAFEQLMVRHQDLVFRVGYAYARQNEAAYDICQNVFIKVYRRLDRFDGRSTFRTWLTRVARNESLDWLRRQKRHQNHEELTTENAPSYAPNQEKDLLQGETRDGLLAEIQALNPKQQQAILLRYFEKMPLREIAAVLECHENQVKNILFRGIRVLRERMPEKRKWNKELGA